MKKTNIVRWGIIGCGNIANKFADDILHVENTYITACSSKNRDRACEFAQKHNIENYYDSYEDMLRSDMVDAVYIATTHNFHYENAMLCLKYNKHVLCEKIFTVNAKQAREIFETAKGKNLFVMEAIWSRFLPVNIWVKKQVLDGQIGDVVSVVAQFGVNFPFDPKSRMYDINLAGGGLLDLGIYPISFICNFLGSNPVRVKGVAGMGFTNVDEQAAVSLLYDKGQTGSATYSMCTNYANLAVVYGTKGRIEVDHTCFAKSAVLYRDDGIRVKFDNDGTNGFEHEIKEAVNSILAGKIQSDIIPARETVQILEICDDLRRQWGLKYPGEDSKNEVGGKL